MSDTRTASLLGVPVALEVLVGPPAGATFDEDWDGIWRHLTWIPVNERTAERSLELMRELAHTSAGAHCRRPIDYLVAACAEQAADDELVLWHWDNDLTVICEHAGIRHESEHQRAKEHGINVEPGARGTERGRSLSEPWRDRFVGFDQERRILMHKWYVLMP